MGIFKKAKAKWVPLKDWERPKVDTLVLIADDVRDDPDSNPTCTKCWYIANRDRFEFEFVGEKELRNADTAMVMEVPQIGKNQKWFKARV